MAENNTNEQTAKRQTKAQIVERLLKARGGATLADLVAATGWQSHSCRAFLSGLRKKGLVPTKDKRKDGTTFYKLPGGQAGSGSAKAPSAEADA